MFQDCIFNFFLNVIYSDHIKLVGNICLLNFMAKIIIVAGSTTPNLAPVEQCTLFFK